MQEREPDAWAPGGPGTGRRQGVTGGRALCAALALLAVHTEAVALDPARELGQYTRRAWSLEQGFPQSTVNDLAQDPAGYIWVATFGGLVRFDGVRPVVFTSAREPGLPSDRLTALAVDEAGELWVGTEASGIAVRRGGRFERVPLLDRPLSVTRLLSARGGGVWVSTADGLFRVKGEATRRFGREDGLPDTSVMTVGYGPGDEVWVGTHRGLCVVSGDRCVPRFAEALSGDSVISLSSGAAGTFIGTTTRLLEVEGDSLRELPVRPGVAVRAVSQDSAGGVWAGFNSGGLHRLKPRPGRLDRAGGLPGDSVKSLLEDREGNLWVGLTANGLVQLSDGPALGIGIVVGGSPVAALPVVSDGADGVFVGTRCEGIAHVRPGGVEMLALGEEPFRDCVWSLLAGDAGDLWIGTFGRGLFRRRGDGALESYDGPPTNGRVVRALAAREGSILVGSDNGVFRFDSRTRRFERVEGTEGLEIFSLEAPADGSLWVGSSRGLRVLSGGSWRVVSKAEGLSNDTVRAVLRDPDGVVWIGTYGGGLSRVEAGRLTTFGTQNGLFEDVVSRIVEDSSGRFWMTGNRGVTRVSRRSLEAFARTGGGPLDAELFDASSGMRTSECNGGGQPAGHLGADGRFWVPTVDGLAVFDTRMETRGDVAPPVRIEEVLVGGRRVAFGNGLVLPSGARNLEIRYTALSYRRPGKVRFRTRLEGLDEEWVEAGTRRVAYYAYLPAGEYRFEVVAANDDGVWNDTGPSLAIRRTARFVETRWFPTLLVLAVAALGLGAVRAVRAVARRREAELARLVEQRTAELRRLVDVAEQINRGTGVDEVLDRVYDSLRDAIPYDRVGLALLDEDRIVLRALWSRSESKSVEIGKGYEAEIASSSLKGVLEAGHPRILNDLEAYLAEHPGSESTRRILQEGIRSSLTLPLRADGLPIGAVFFSSFRKGAYDASHVRLLEGLVGHLSIVVSKSRLLDDLLATKARLEAANAELSRIASADALTGLPNRRAFDEAYVTEWRRAMRSGEPITVLMVDVDRFKAFNDRYGHAAGDECLREVARALASRIRRAGDIVARWGGEEFVAVLGNCGREEARLLAERIRDVVAQRRIPHEASTAGVVTVSVGAATRVPRPDHDPADLPRLADEAMYVAKRAGRNRVELIAG